MVKLRILLLILCCGFQFAKSQDIHFSQFNKSYLNLNPALTGSFNGDFRFNGNYRNQWSSVSEPFETYSIAMDLKNPIKQLAGLHLGGVIFNDEAGLGGLKMTQANLSLGYSYGLNYDSTLIAKTGVQIGYSARSINFDQFSFDQQYNGNRYDPNLSTGESFDKNSYGSINLHIRFGLEYLIENRKKLNFGLSIFNLTKPNQSFEGITVPLESRAAFQLGADYLINNKIDILPSVLYSKQGPYTEFLVGTDLRYRLNRSLASNVYGGVWYRNQDALILSTGMDYLQWNLGISYDINISELESASNKRGGLELSITYIFKNFKPTIRRHKVCPSFM